MVRGGSHRIVIAAVLIVCVALVSGAFASRGRAGVSGLRYTSASGHTRVVIDLTRTADFSINRLKNPHRLYVDIFNADLNRAVSEEVEVSDGLLKSIRSARYDSDTVRVVMDLADIGSYKVFRLSGPPRLVIDIFGEGGEASKPELNSCTVVLDAGHGGKDPGAIGPRGIMEKDVVLDVARRVKRLLDGEKSCEAVLTRDRDVFLSLEERTAIANKKGADLFVSIHANANRNKGLRGMETYLLNWTDNEEAMEVAARENMISLKTMKQGRSELGVMLASLALNWKRDESVNLANYVQDSMVSQVEGSYDSVTDLGVKQALFYVLVGAKMPSVLVEVSYITNGMEAQRLASPAYREHLARGIASGIKTYVAKSQPVQEIARR